MATKQSKTGEITPQQQKVLDVLTRSDKALSAYDILDQLHETGIKSPPTVYRALEKLASAGLIHRIESLNAYVACCQHHDCGHDHDHDHASQFAICTGCGRVEEIVNDALGDMIGSASKDFLKQVDSRVLEVSGLCNRCAA